MQASRTYRDLDAVLIIDKPRGISSNDALQQVKRLYQARKAGHCGSLDPLATGVLPICLGQATKFSGYLLGADKAYRALCQLGQTTTTADAEGEVVDSKPVDVTRAQVVDALQTLTGNIAQIPPMHSALKFEGKRLYQLARKGITVERKPRDVTVHSIDLISIENDCVEINVRCSKGTYIRTLAEDLGEKLGCGAHLSQLHRFAVDPFDEERAVSIDHLRALSEQGNASIDELLLPVSAALSQFPQLELEHGESRDICQGKSLPSPPNSSAGLYRLMTGDGRFIGLGEVMEDASLVAKRLMNTAR
jgi:tRNA pseudouridine55 synthase